MTLELPDQLAGKQVRCKRCQKVLKVPQRGTRKFASRAAEEDSTSELLVAGSRICPGCQETYPPSIVVCTACGLNLDTGAMLYASLEEQRSPFAEPEGEAQAKGSWLQRLLGKLGLKK
jgi:hypothetical protein